MNCTVAILLIFACTLHSSAHSVHESTGNDADIPSVFQHFLNHGKGRRLWLARYQDARSKCSWESDVESLEYDYDWFATDKIMRDSYWSYLVSQLLITTYYPEVPNWLKKLLHFIFGPTSRGPSLQSHSCRVTDSEGTEFRVRRLGPFVGNGGFDWHKMKMQDPYSLRPRVEQDTVHVTGFMAMPVNENGEILGNPPIHIHHANLGPNRNRSSLSRLSQWHGDSQCAESEGGTACYVTALPPGFGFPVSEALRLDLDFNDVRPLNSPAMKFWLETSVSIAKPQDDAHQIRDIGTVILGVPFRGRWWKTSDLQRLYFVPTDQPSALWVTGRMPTAGTFVAGGKIEVHQHMLDEALVFTNISPEDLGLNSDIWKLRKPWQPWIPRENGWKNSTAAMAALKSRVLENFEQALRQCRQDTSCEKPPTLIWRLNRTVFEEGEERQMPWPQNTWTFAKDEQFTTVIFHRAVAMPGHDHPAEMPQHLAITGYYIPDAGSRANYWFVLPSSNADWAWTNSVNWFHALMHAGGPPVELWNWPVAMAALSTLVMTAMGMRCIQKLLRASCASQLLIDSSGKSKHQTHSYSAVHTQVESDAETECEEKMQITQEAQESDAELA